MVPGGVFAELMEVIGVLYRPSVFGIATFLAFIVIGLIVGQINKRLLIAVGVPKTVEGTAFERTARGLDTSTVAIIARLSSWFIYGIGFVVALHVAGVLDPNVFWQEVTRLVPRVFVAVLVFIVGIVAGDKAELIVNERLRGIKLPEAGILGSLTKYSIIYVAALMALGQIGVSTAALLILLAVYAFGLVFVGGLACRDLLASGAAGVYLLLHAPYGIGDTVRIDSQRGVVQEVDLFVTRIESDDEEHIIPNRRIITDGATRIRG